MLALGETFTEKASMAGRKGKAPRCYIIGLRYQGRPRWFSLVNKQAPQRDGADWKPNQLGPTASVRSS
jgi:hypothetical protein